MKAITGTESKVGSKLESQTSNTPSTSKEFGRRKVVQGLGLTGLWAYRPVARKAFQRLAAHR